MPIGSPLLDQYDRDGIVTPGLQRALEITRQKLGEQFQLPGQPQPATPTPRLSAPSPVPQISRPSGSPPSAMAGSGAANGGAAPTPTLAPTMQHDRDELTRLTDPTLPSSKSGIEQIHNSWVRTPLRVLDAIGSAFAPRLTSFLPGTQLHHQGLVNLAASSVARDQKQLADQANQSHLEAETSELGSRGKEEEARAEALLHPPTKEKAGDPTKTIETSEGIMQFNPDTGKYDIPLGSAPGKEQQNVHVLPDGSVVAVHHDPKSGKSSAEVLYKGDPKEEPGHVIQRLVNGKMHNVLVDAKSGEDRKDLGETRQQNAGSDHGVTMIDPATNRVVRVEPGQTAPSGAMTPQQSGSLNVPTAQTRTMAETAPKVLDFVDRIGKMVDQQAASLGPAASRWNEFMAGKVGAPNPEFTKLRTDIGLLQTALMRMHVGARGGEQMMEHFRNLIDLSKQSPENLKAALGEIREYANAVKGNHQGQSTAVDPQVKAYADRYFSGDVAKAQAAIEAQKKK